MRFRPGTNLAAPRGALQTLGKFSGSWSVAARTAGGSGGRAHPSLQAQEAPLQQELCSVPPRRWHTVRPRAVPLCSSCRKAVMFVSVSHPAAGNRALQAASGQVHGKLKQWVKTAAKLSVSLKKRCFSHPSPSEKKSLLSYLYVVH